MLRLYDIIKRHIKWEEKVLDYNSKFSSPTAYYEHEKMAYKNVRSIMNLNFNLERNFLSQNQENCAIRMIPCMSYLGFFHEMLYYERFRNDDHL